VATPAPPITKAGADAADAYGDHYRAIIANDPDIQRVIKGVWGETPIDQRPSDTPKHLEAANAKASKTIAAIMKAKGIPLPERSFVNPRSGALEGHRGWSGLNGVQKTAIIAAATIATGGIAAAAMGGAAAGAGAAGAAASTGVTTGVPAGLAGVGATGIGAGGATLGGSTLTGALTSAGINAAKTKLTGGSWKDAAIAGATGAATGGAGMGWSDTLINAGKDLAKDPNTYASLTSALAKGKEAGRGQQNAANADRATFEQRERSQFEQALLQRAMLELQQKQFGSDERQRNARSALQAAFGMNAEDVTLDAPQGVPVVNFKGGIRPSAIGQQGRDVAAEMYGQSMKGLKEGTAFSPLPALERTSAPQYEGAGFIENLLGGAAAVGKEWQGQQARTNANEQSALIKSLLDEVRANSARPVGSGQTAAAAQTAPTPTIGTPAPVFRPMGYDPKNPYGNVRF
jgi:hypothetical protein